MTAKPSLKAAQADATKRALLDVARELFTERGYAGAATEEIVQRAGVTRGALYYHFRDKRGLFFAVADEVEQRLMLEIGLVAATEPDPLKRLRSGCQAFLNACLDPTVQRILLVDGRAAIGPEEFQRLMEKYSFAGVRMGIEAIAASYGRPKAPAEALAHLLIGALNEAAANVVRSSDVHAARLEMGAAIDELLSSLAGV